jgi:hypothetical protein
MSLLRSPRLWLWVGLFFLALGILGAVRGLSTGGEFGLGYAVGSLLPGLAILYLGWYRRRGV